MKIIYFSELKIKLFFREKDSRQKVIERPAARKTTGREPPLWPKAGTTGTLAVSERGPPPRRSRLYSAERRQSDKVKDALVWGWRLRPFHFPAFQTRFFGFRRGSRRPTQGRLSAYEDFLIEH